MSLEKELRVGNYVDVFGVKTITSIERGFSGCYKIEVTERRPSGMYWSEWVNLNSLELSLIPITEELMLKLGFNIISKEQFFINFIHPDFIPLKINFSFTRYYSIAYFNGTGLPKALRYIYQVQNLYFELTGSELTFKED